MNINNSDQSDIQNQGSGNFPFVFFIFALLLSNWVINEGHLYLYPSYYSFIEQPIFFNLAIALIVSMQKMRIDESLTLKRAQPFAFSSMRYFERIVAVVALLSLAFVISKKLGPLFWALFIFVSFKNYHLTKMDVAQFSPFHRLVHFTVFTIVLSMFYRSHFWDLSAYCLELLQMILLLSIPILILNKIPITFFEKIDFLDERTRQWFTGNCDMSITQGISGEQSELTSDLVTPKARKILVFVMIATGIVVILSVFLPWKLHPLDFGKIWTLRGFDILRNRSFLFDGTNYPKAEIMFGLALSAASLVLSALSSKHSKGIVALSFLVPIIAFSISFDILRSIAQQMEKREYFGIGALLFHYTMGLPVIAVVIAIVVKQKDKLSLKKSANQNT